VLIAERNNSVSEVSWQIRNVFEKNKEEQQRRLLLDIVKATKAKERLFLPVERLSRT
jgi:hypothetical protein